MSAWGVGLGIAMGLVSVGAVVVCYAACVVAGIADDQEETALPPQPRRSP